jgi:hypothetical protein
MIRCGGQNQPFGCYFRFHHSGAMPQSPNSLIFSRLHPSLRTLLYNPGLISAFSCPTDNMECLENTLWFVDDKPGKKQVPAVDFSS